MKPKSVEIYPVYVCSKCGSKHTETLAYVNKIGKILCYCDEVIYLEPIKTFNISPVYVNKEVKTKKNNKVEKKWTVQESIDDTIDRIKDIELRMVSEPDMSEHNLKVFSEAKKRLETTLNELIKQRRADRKNREWPPARKTWRETQDKEFFITNEATEQCLQMMTSLGWKKGDSSEKIKKASKEFYKQNSDCKIDMDNFETFASFLLAQA